MDGLAVWPHDNALIGLGMARYGFKEEVNRLFKGMIDAASYDELRRLPELFCGFPRRRHQGPTSYPVACSPQAWAAGTLFALVSAACGFELDADAVRVTLNRPSLPDALRSLSVRNLPIAEASVSLDFSRILQDVTVAVEYRRGPIQVSIQK